MLLHTFEMTEAQANMLHRLVDSHMQALKNWTASAIEHGEFERAQGLVRELRAHENLFAQFNMRANRDIAESTGKALRTHHTVRL